MSVEQFTVKGKHELDLKGIRVMPKKNPKAVIQIFHGKGEHKERYIPFMEFMARNGYAVYAHDHRKHGASVKKEEDVGIFLPNDRFDDVLDDCYYVSRKILKDVPGAKLIILGHSMGSVIARLFISKNALLPHATILMGNLSPISKGKAVVPTMLARIVKIFTGRTKRSQFIENLISKPLLDDIEEPRTDLDWLSFNEKNVDDYIDDPLCGYAYSPQFYVQFFKAIVASNNSNIIMRAKDRPILLISGEADPIGGNGAGVEELERSLNGHGFTGVTMNLVPNARHEVLHENNKQETFDYLLKWCESVL